MSIIFNYLFVVYYLTWLSCVLTNTKCIVVSHALKINKAR